MIKRTYRSKKNTLSALDHKDVLHTIDDKASVFDAFYIQKIKQTKRELSCLGSSSQYVAPLTKVRKKKYVKRIVKEVDPVVRESLSESIYMTPDKSIHVKKAPDLFDQLLNSSNNRTPTNTRHVPLSDKLLKPMEGKRYTRKKTNKKYNYSSSDYDSEKENNVTNNSDVSQNVSDIKSHKLLIEKDNNFKTKADESVFHVLDKLPQLQKQYEQNNKQTSSRFSLKLNEHRLTKNMDLFIDQNCPSCSTPFKEKLRSYSIYKFSPIRTEDLKDSPQCVTIVEKDPFENNIKSLNDYQQSPILQTNRTNLSKYINKLSPEINTQNEEKPENKVNCTDNISENVKKDNTPSNYTFNQQASEYKSFLGFSNVSRQCSKLKNAQSISKISINNNNNSSIDRSKDFTTIPKENQSLVNSFTSCTEVEPFKGFTHVTLPKLSKLEEICLVDSQLLDDSNNLSSRTYNSQVIENNTDHEILEATILNAENVSSNSPIEGVKSSNNSTTSSDYENAEQTCYDSCDSLQTDEEPPNEVCPTDPKIKIERLNSTTFKKYYEVYKNCGKTEPKEQNSSQDSDDSSSSSGCCDITKGEFSEHSLTIEHNTEAAEVFSIVLSSSEGDVAGTKSNDEENCVSFVTTRRRNGIASRSSLYTFDETITSPGSSECDKTVINVNNEINLSPELALTKNNLDKYQQDLKEVMEERKAKLKKRKSSLRRSVMTRKSCNIVKESNVETLDENTPASTKPGIILQPGKRWERSLSIYRRMTMNNDHFDNSIIDMEDETYKGRKYRQSVIDTMTNQNKSLINNVSVSSRRSTFISKPSRSSIRILKSSNTSRLSLSVSPDLNDIKDDTLLELSKLSIADSEREVTVLDQFDDTRHELHESRGPTARDYVLRRCNQTDVIHFDECYPETELKNCRKIGEGVYGEVFLWRARDGLARVMKIVPIAGTVKVNGENQKDFQEIIAEIVIAMELSALRAPLSEIELNLDEGKDIETLDLHSIGNATDVFNEILAVRCVYGSYPSRLLDLWELYDETKGSENDSPAVLPSDQQYIVLELANAGQDLESYQFNNTEQAHALFWQVAFGLAVGEEAYQFEHRDLHWGNVLIAPTDQKFATFVLRGRPYRLPRCGVSATIIDYSLSRLSLDLYGSSAALYNDLATDEALFDAAGDYQFDVYRQMRDKLGNEWKNYEPCTNILWLHYTLDKMITALRYKRTNTKVHKHYIAKLKGIKNRILDYGSASQFVLTDNEH